MYPSPLHQHECIIKAVIAQGSGGTSHYSRFLSFSSQFVAAHCQTVWSSAGSVWDRLTFNNAHRPLSSNIPLKDINIIDVNVGNNNSVAALVHTVHSTIYSCHDLTWDDEVLFGEMKAETTTASGHFAAGAPPCAGPEGDERDSDRDWGHWTRGIQTPSPWLAAPDSPQGPHQVAKGFAGGSLMELTLLEESAIPDAGHAC